MDLEPTKKQPNNWDFAEIDAAVKTYLEMLHLQREGMPYVKADYRRKMLAGPLKNRSGSSFENRMRNISYVLQELGHITIKGYKPLEHVGPTAYELIVKAFNNSGFSYPEETSPTPDIDVLEQRTRRIIRRMDLQSRPIGQIDPKKTDITVRAFYRDPNVRAWVLKNAGGNCEACDEAAPFTLSDGSRYLEVHHMVPLAQGGPDIIENTVAICPNCHRRAHLSVDKAQFNTSIYLKVQRLDRDLKPVSDRT